MPLTVGVLIIGSLYWRKGGRKRWRRWRLMNQEWLVNAPIQYCRLSGNKTYTMVFSDLPKDQFGLAKVVQCKRTVKSTSDLITEAEWLWSAEESTEKKDKVPRFCVCPPEGRISPKKGDWGCVALLNNPRSKVPAGLLDKWAKHVAKEAHYNANERRLVDDQGMLQIPWPNLSLDGSPVPMDLLLATSNDREATCPTVQEIADAWNQHPEVDYFRRNRNHEIETFQDQEICKLLH
jgi:hypothetical protein